MWRASAPITIACCALVVIGAAATYAVMLGSAQVVAAAVGGRLDVTSLTVTLLALVVHPLTETWIDPLATAHQERMVRRQHRLLAAAALAPHGIGHLEDPRRSADLQSLISFVRGELGLHTMPAVWETLTFRLQGLAAVLVVGRWSWPAAVILAATQMVHSRVFSRYLDVIQKDLLEDSSIERRRAAYLRSFTLERAKAKEVRLFGLTQWAVEAYSRAWYAAMEGIWARRTAAVKPAYAALSVAALVVFGVFALLGWDVWHASTGAALALATVQGIAGTSALGPIGDTQVEAQRARTIEAQIDEVAGSLPGTIPSVSSSNEHTAASISFDDVTFTYPSRDEPVFRNLDLHIPAGQSVAVVGVNGVGKSTLIKLLCGLYPPGSGTVRIDGRDPAADDATRRRVAVIFQDFVRYQLDLRSNVALPLLAAGRSDDTVTARALEDAAGADVLRRIGGDWSTVLDPAYDGGTDLSGGQWQRVALARALTAVDAGAGVLVLDEPTAALDVRAEAQIFSRFLQVTRGVTSILVSHRLSSVRHAERIVVLGPDGVVEDGSHEELMDENGPYAEMFALQASRFAAAGAQEATDA